MSAGGTEVEQILACLATLFCAGQVRGEAPARQSAALRRARHPLQPERASCEWPSV